MSGFTRRSPRGGGSAGGSVKRSGPQYVGRVPRFLADFGVKTRDAAQVEDLQAKFKEEDEHVKEDYRELVDDLEAAVIVNPDVIQDEPPEEPIEDDMKCLTEDREGIRTLESDEISELASQMRFRKSAECKKRLPTAEDKEKEMSNLKGMKRLRQESTSTKKPYVQLSFDTD
ncbi:MAG: uncharacterized protein KVP18_003128 [Porospora cf. gigantea A]|uniref:uncharacterized protein n=1 Tax=Porospora cf. gigantea A TaxID=2853593 RepID=UPI003559C4AF|nr:MAG: hypothetical protein KVP18_003128 [Porospora cf. gigantea A]